MTPAGLRDRRRCPPNPMAVTYCPSDCPNSSCWPSWALGVGTVGSSPPLSPPPALTPPPWDLSSGFNWFKHLRCGC